MKYSITFLIAYLMFCNLGFSRSKNQKLIRNIDYIKKTEVNKYNWDDPAAKYLVLDNRFDVVTDNELEGLKKYALNAWLPTHNSMNYYFRKRSNSYMLEWLYKKDNDIALLNRAIEIAELAVIYRNDNIEKVDDKFTSYKISYDRSVAPVWPNYKELEVYEDGTHGLAPGASGFAGVPLISIPVRMIAENKDLWQQKYNGETYYDIAIRLASEAQKTIDYTYKIFVGEDNLIRYPKTMQRSEWHNNVFIYNRVFPVMSGAIPLVEAYKIFNINSKQIQKIDAVNQSMIDFLQGDMVFYEENSKTCVKYPYSDEAQENNPDQCEDFTHGSFDSRDFQEFYISNRYNWTEKYVHAMANTLVEVTSRKDGTFAERLNGKGDKKYGTPISFDGYIWYAKYRPEIKGIIIDHIIDNKVALKNGVYDAYCIYEILKVKDAKNNINKLVYSNSFDSKESLNDWIIEGAGEMSVVNGELKLNSKYDEVTQAYIEAGGRKVRDFVEGKMKEDISKRKMKDFYLNGKFQDAHFVCWNKFVTPNNYILECDFTSVVNYPLHMIMFSHMGVNGEGVFHKRLDSRNGIAAQYTKGDMVGYRISYFHPERETSNLRKSPEQQILVTGTDATDQSPKEKHHLKITKIENRVTWEINGEESFCYCEKDNSKVLGGGYFAIRLMNPAVGKYDNVKVYEVVR